jgi:hypothetical protein
MRKALGSAAALLAALVFLALPACQPRPKGENGIGAPRAIDCASQAIGEHAGEALGPVNHCLASEGSIDACLLGLVQPAVGITVDLIGCLTKREGSSASAASQANPADTADRQRAARAREFLEHMQARGFAFEH